MSPCEMATYMRLVLGVVCVHLSIQASLHAHNCTIDDSDHNCVRADCRKRNLTSIPSNLPRETCVLLVQHNQITEVANGVLKIYTNITMLYLSHNHISYLDNTSFEGVASLLELHLDNNRLTDQSLPNGTFRPLDQLTVLAIYRNTFTDYLNESISDLPSLEALFIDGLENQVFGSAYRNLSVLKNLTLSGDIGGCRLDTLINGTFQNVPQLRMLNISSCGLKSVDAGAFRPLVNLDVLDISRNHDLGFVSLRNITHGFKDSPIRVLYLNEIKHPNETCIILTQENLEFLQYTNITEIHANNNRLSGFSQGALGFLPITLKTAFLKYNRMLQGPYLHDLKMLTGLEYLTLDNHHDKHYLVFGPILRSLWMSSGADLYTDVDRVHNVQQQCREASVDTKDAAYGATLDSGVQCLFTDDTVHIQVPPRLKRFSYTYSELAFVLSKMQFSENVLELINISSNVITIWEGPIFGLENLTTLYLSNNIAYNVSTLFFSQFNSLLYLDISSNFLGRCIANDVDGKIFANLTNLRHLDLSTNMIKHLPHKIFKGLTSLRTLHLSENQLVKFDTAFKFTPQLRYLWADRNQIKWPCPNDLGELDDIRSYHNLTVDLSSNPYVCTCDLLDFLQWLSSTDVNISYHGYTCSYMNKNVSLDSLMDDLNSACDLKHFGLAVGTLTCFLLIVILIAAAIAFRYKWKLRYWYYAAKLRMRSSDVLTADYEYDAFVAYADEDRFFVKEILIPNLEEKHDIKLIIHDRDFLPGRPICENIIESIQKSKKTMLILTEDFLKSTWCKYELQMATMEQAASGRDVLLIVLMCTIPTQQIPLEIIYHVHNQTYIEYPEDGVTDMFWSSLARSLKAD